MDVDEFLDKELEGLDTEEIREEIILEKDNKELEKFESNFQSVLSSIKKGKLTEAEKNFAKLWIEISTEKFTWKQELYNMLIDVNEKLIDTLSHQRDESEATIRLIRDKITQIKNHLLNNESTEALDEYKKIIDAYNSIPDVFLGEKKTLYVNEILPLYKEMIEKVEKTFFNMISSEVSKINEFMKKSREAIKKNNSNEAIKYYSDCLNLFNSLPYGYFKDKVELSKKLLEIYKEISIITEIADLKSQLNENLVGVIDKNYKTLNQRIDSVIPPLPTPPQDIFHKPHKEKKEEKKKNRPDKLNVIDELKNTERKLLKSSEKTEHKSISDKSESSKRHDLADLRSIAKKKLPEKKSGPGKINLNKDHDILKKVIEKAKNKGMMNKPFTIKKHPHIKDKIDILPAKKLEDKPIKENKKNEFSSILPKDNKVIKFDGKKPTKSEILIKHDMRHSKAKFDSEIRSELIKRKFERADLRDKKGEHTQALKELHDILRLEPDNKSAKEQIERIKSLKS